MPRIATATWGERLTALAMMEPDVADVAPTLKEMVRGTLDSVNAVDIAGRTRLSVQRAENALRSCTNARVVDRTDAGNYILHTDWP